MKKFLKAALLITLMGGLSLRVSLAGQFEGEVDYNMTMSNGDQSQMSYFLKGSKARMEMTMKGHHIVSIIDIPDKKIYMLMTEQKMYMISNIPQPQKAATSHFKMTKTGNTKTILGHTTEEWQTTSSDGRTQSIWSAKGMGFFLMGRGPGGQGPDAPWAAELRKEGVFPLEVDSTGGKNDMSMVATQINEKSLDDSLFTVPSGYKDMSSMMQGLGGMPGGVHVPGL